MRLLRTIHLWAGLVAGLFLSVLGVTGSLLLFREPLERVAPRHPSQPGCAALPVDESLARAMGGLPGARVTYVQFPLEDGGPLEVVAQSGGRVEFVAVDQCSGALLGKVQEGRPWLRTVSRMHRTLLLGDAGRGALGVLGVALLFLAVSGGVIALRSPQSLHRRAGIAFLPFLVMYAVSGTWLVAGSARGESRARTNSAPARQIANYVAAAMREIPRGRVSWVQLGDPVVVRLKLPEDLQKRGSQEVVLHPTTGATVRVDLFENKSTAERLRVGLAAFHLGEPGGGWAIPIFVVAALSPVLLAISACILLKRNRYRQKVL